MGIVKTTTPFVNATTLMICTHVIWDFTRNVEVSEIKVIFWRAAIWTIYDGEGLYYTWAGSRGADIGAAQLGLLSYFGKPNFGLLLG